MKKLSLGISDFKKLIEGNYYYVDKTLLIKELYEASGEVILIPRPRRFGKTLNLSMLKYFFERSEIDNRHLFNNTAIWQDTYYHNLQGQYPVIFLTFKDIKEKKWEDAYEHLTKVIAQEFAYYEQQLLPTLSEHEKLYYMLVLKGQGSRIDYARSLYFLSEALSKHYKKSAFLLLDEYDAPIHAAYNNGYYKEMIDFMRSLLTSALKDNSYLERGVLTGILRTAKEGIFSGLNNLKVYSLTNSVFQDKFGFTEAEVRQFLKDQKLPDKLPEVQEWYNGYLFGTVTIYNPWSILMCADERGLLQPYWLNTSDNQLIKKLIALSDDELKSDFELLLSGQAVTKEISEAIIFPGIENNSRAVWSLLLFTGYLTYAKLEIKEGITYCDLVIPNKEIKILYKSFIQDIFTQSLTTQKIKALLTSLTQGDALLFGELLQEFVSASMSVYDLPADEPEKSYHLFVLGLLILLSDEYEIKSNRESGFGRYDIMIIPRKSNKLGIIVEFKKVSAIRNETLEIAAQKALEQIKEKQYAQELKQRGIKHIKLFGIAFQGKKVLVLSQDHI